MGNEFVKKLKEKIEHNKYPELGGQDIIIDDRYRIEFFTEKKDYQLWFELTLCVREVTLFGVIVDTSGVRFTLLNKSVAIWDGYRQDF